MENTRIQVFTNIERIEIFWCDQKRKLAAVFKRLEEFLSAAITERRFGDIQGVRKGGLRKTKLLVTLEDFSTYGDDRNRAVHSKTSYCLGYLSSTHKYM